MTQKWNLQDIRPAEPRRRRSMSPNEEARVPQDDDSGDNISRQRVPQNHSDDADTIVITDGKKSTRSKYIILGVSLLVIIGGVFGISALISKTTLTVYPENNQPTVNAEFTAYAEKRTGELSYEIMTLDAEGEAQVKATGQIEVKEQATGMLEIIKSTPGTERLIKNTRFRSPDGLVYRIQESVVVPGAIKNATGDLIPGTIQAEVFADDTGQQYNLAAGTRFDIPGFKESNLPELYNSIYAENRSAFTGGFAGPRFNIDENELATAKQQLQINLRNQLLAKISSEKPADFFAFPGSIAITYSSLPAIEYGENLVTIREQAVLQIPLFKEGDCARYIASETIPSYSQESVRITNGEQLTFAYIEPNTNSVVLADLPSLNFTILGKPQIVWNFDAKKLQQDLAGKSFTALSLVLTGHTGIKRAEITSKPFWRRSFPENGDDIVLTEVIN